ncbi:MAG TPA: transcription elongation factor GreA [Fimbriimonadaceae bacterium]|nr:transcription elongation factor GreA [Fimbriimonadaceae bacterium]
MRAIAKPTMDEIELESTEPILLTKEGHTRLQEELRRLSVVKRAEIAERIRESKDHGEYSEDNSELDEVKVEQALVESRISELKITLSNAEVLESRKIPTKTVGLGSRVTLRETRRRTEFEVRVVASAEANPDEDLISEESPLGQAIMGKEVGEVANYEAPAGTLRYKIVKIRR